MGQAGRGARPGSAERPTYQLWWVDQEPRGLAKNKKERIQESNKKAKQRKWRKELKRKGRKDSGEVV